jgi:hypothetical protein
MRFMPMGAGIVGGIFAVGIIVIGLGRFPLLWYFFVPAVVMGLTVALLLRVMHR